VRDSFVVRAFGIVTKKERALVVTAPNGAIHQLNGR
jgi:hypothetical protein